MKYISFNLFRITFVLLSLANIAQANNRLSGQDLKEIIKQHANGAGIELEAIIAAKKVFYPCNSDLQIVPKYENWQTVEVICTMPYSWKLSIRTKITSPETEAVRLGVPSKPETSKRLTPVVRTIMKRKQQIKKPQQQIKKRDSYNYVVFAEPVSKGTVLNENMAFEVKEYMYKIRGGFTDLNQIIGRKLKYPVSEGAPILARYLTKNYAVEKNTILDIIVRRSGVKITGKGSALSNGQLGEIIIVSNVDTGAKLKARIKSSFEAEIIAKHSQ